MTYSEIHEKYSKTILPFEQCFFCENIGDCPHPDVNDKGSPICPENCKRTDEIKLTKK